MSSRRVQLRKSSSSSTTSASASQMGSNYYGGARAGVPFRWESKPGTPKHPSSSSCLSGADELRLNPPPCYNVRRPVKTNSNKPSAIFTKLFTKMGITTSSGKQQQKHSGLVSPNSSTPLITIFRRSRSTPNKPAVSTFYNYQQHLYLLDQYNRPPAVNMSSTSPTSSSTRCFWPLLH